MSQGGFESQRRAIVVHDRDHAEAALAAAAAAGVPVVLLSPPGAAAYMGAGYFRALVEAAAAAHPMAKCLGMLDCGDRAGDALGALREGTGAIVFHGDAEAAAKIADIARQLNAAVLAERPEALDLADAGDAAAACAAWLAA